MEKLISTGYLYRFWNDRLIVKKGIVIQNQWCSKREAQFRYGKRDGDWTKCNPEPGKLVWGSCWLTERDDDLARKLLIEYHTETIERLQKQIASHEEKIKFLQDA